MLSKTIKHDELPQERAWIVPAYTLPPDAEDVAVFRVVIRESFSRDMAELLSEDLARAVKTLQGTHPTRSHARAKAKSHRVC